MDKRDAHRALELVAQAGGRYHRRGRRRVRPAGARARTSRLHHDHAALDRGHRAQPGREPEDARSAARMHPGIGAGRRLEERRRQRDRLFRHPDGAGESRFRRAPASGQERPGATRRAGHGAPDRADRVALLRRRVGESGGAGGAASWARSAARSINTLFIDHFQDMAKGHFIVRRLERAHGAAERSDASTSSCKPRLQAQCNMYDVSVAFGGGACSSGTSTVAGIGCLRLERQASLPGRARQIPRQRPHLRRHQALRPKPAQHRRRCSGTESLP